MKRGPERVIYFLFGFFSYSLIEILWRKYTHWTMSITGGMCFVLLHGLFERCRGLCLWKKCLLGGFSITGVEFTVGCVVNLWLKWDVWDYSMRPGNLLGQVCPLYTFLWSLLCLPLVGLNAFLHARLRGHAPAGKPGGARRSRWAVSLEASGQRPLASRAGMRPRASRAGMRPRASRTGRGGHVGLFASKPSALRRKAG